MSGEFARCLVCGELHMAVDAGELGGEVAAYARCRRCGAGEGFRVTDEVHLDELTRALPACVLEHR